MKTFFQTSFSKILGIHGNSIKGKTNNFSVFLYQ